MTPSLSLMSLLPSLLVVMGGVQGKEANSLGSVATSQVQQSNSTSRACTGTVTETMNSGGYTYVKVACGDRAIWAAGPQTVIVAGDRVTIDQDMRMTNFRSSTLNRTFDAIYFVSAIRVAGSGGDVGARGGDPTETIAGAHRSVPGNETTLDFSMIRKPEGGKTVAEILAGKLSLSGTEVLVRGKVVKFNAGILGRNWLHLQDGTGSPGSNELTVTTNATAKIGDTVLVRGKLMLDKDFGFGYKYEVLIEDALVSVE